MKTLIVIFFILINNSFAQSSKQKKPGAEKIEEPQTQVELSKELKVKFDELKALTPEKYVTQVDGYRDYLERYILYKRGVCAGDFSTIVLQEEKRTDQEEFKTLSAQEKKLCYAELKSIQTQFIQSLYTARLRFIKDLHTRELQKIETSRQKELDDLNKRFNRKNY